MENLTNQELMQDLLQFVKDRYGYNIKIKHYNIASGFLVIIKNDKEIVYRIKISSKNY